MKSSIPLLKSIRECAQLELLHLSNLPPNPQIVNQMHAVSSMLGSIKSVLTLYEGANK